MKRNRIADKVTIKVKCGGRSHRVTFQDGPVILHDHEARDLRLLRMTQALAGESSGCLKVLFDYRMGEAKTASLRGLRAKLCTKRRASDPEPSAVPLRQRLHLWVKDLVRTAIETCPYRRSKSRWAGGRHETQVEYAPDGANCSGHARKVWSSNGKWSGNNSVWRVRVSFGWVGDVYMSGLAMIDGTFILAVLDAGPPMRVLAVRQGKGFNLHPMPARIKIDKDDVSRLRWETKRQALQVAQKA